MLVGFPPESMAGFAAANSVGRRKPRPRRGAGQKGGLAG